MHPLIEAFGWSYSFGDFMNSISTVIGVLIVYFLKRIFDKIDDIGDRQIQHEQKHIQTEKKFTEIDIDIDKMNEKVNDHAIRISRLEP